MPNNTNKTIAIEALKDKILGGWTGKSYGCMMGEPMEYAVQGEFYEGSLAIQPKAPTTWLHNEDDLYVNMALLEVMGDRGVDASADDYAKVFRESKFMLWHANGQARQNILAGIDPRLSGHPLYNPHADDIDFQIECDFIGLVCPGLPQRAQKISHEVGHLMNYGEGYYAGVFLAALYAAAFIEHDRLQMIYMALKAIPPDCDYAKQINDLLAWFADEPDNWRATWHKLEDKWNFDLCPWAKTEAGRFNIQGHFNGCYILIGLLYGKGDYMESIGICTRCGQDTDSNVGNCGGIMGTLLGYRALPQCVRDELAPYMDRNYNFTNLSINSASELCFHIALENIARHDGHIKGDTATIAIQPFNWRGEREVSFHNFEFVEVYKALDPNISWHGTWKAEEAAQHQAGYDQLVTSSQPGDYVDVPFRGTCIYMQSTLKCDHGILEVHIDGQLAQTRDLYVPEQWNNCSQSTAAWVTGLKDGDHTMRILVTGRQHVDSAGCAISLGRAVSYRGEVAALPTLPS